MHQTPADDNRMWTVIYTVARIVASTERSTGQGISHQHFGSMVSARFIERREWWEGDVAEGRVQNSYINDIKTDAIVCLLQEKEYER